MVSPPPHIKASLMPHMGRDGRCAPNPRVMGEWGGALVARGGRRGRGSGWGVAAAEWRPAFCFRIPAGRRKLLRGRRKKSSRQGGPTPVTFFRDARLCVQLLLFSQVLYSCEDCSGQTRSRSHHTKYVILHHASIMMPKTCRVCLGGPLPPAPPLIPHRAHAAAVVESRGASRVGHQRQGPGPLPPPASSRGWCVESLGATLGDRARAGGRGCWGG